MIIALLSLVAGLLTVLAPCVLPFLPVIVGGSLTGQKWRPYVVAGSLVASLVVFTLALKASSALLGVHPAVWTTVSGALVVALGLTMLFPDAWAKVSGKLGFAAKSHEMLDAAREKKGVSSAILTGAALGPVFSSCSPTYAWVLATILPVNPAQGIIYLAIYCVGLAVALLGITLVGRALIARLKWAANPRGWFQKSIAVIFIAVGLAVATGVDRQVQTALADYSLSIAALEEKLVPVNDTDGASSTSEAALMTGDLSRSYPAPDFTGIESWINSEPLTMSDLSGKVVLVDFWTYSCINCIRTQPYLNAWHDSYADKGLVIVGVHAPEFAFEKVPANVQKAVIEAGIHYPVALDNDFATWNAYNNHYWPAKYLIDQNGQVRYVHFGEGEYEETEHAIRTLLGLDGSDRMAAPSVEDLLANATDSSAAERFSAGQSPETYVGYRRAERYVGSPMLQAGQHEFSGAPSIPAHSWALEGAWRVEPEYAEAAEDGAKLLFRFSGRTMHLVMSADSPRKVRVGDQELTVSNDSLYTVVRLPEVAHDTLVELEFEAGVRAYAFTFGS